MANKEELKNMVLQFKVTDLQLLLGFAGQNKNGRKSELQKKAVNLIVYKMSIPLEMKIRQMYRDMIPENNVPKTNNGYYMPNNYTNKYDNYYVNGYSRQTSQNTSYDNYHPMNYYPNNQLDYCDNFWPSLSYPNYSLNGHEGQSPKLNSTNSGNFNIKMPSTQNLSNITFKKLPFFKYKSDILSVIPMMAKKQHGEFYELMHPFSLNQQQISRLNWSKKNEEHRYQVQLRICALNEGAEVSDDLPLALTVKVNDKNCQLPPAIPSTNKQGMLLKRMNAPINITSQTSRKNAVNSLFISWSVSSDKLYGVGIFLVRKYSADELVEKLKQKGDRDPEVTKKYLSDKLGQLDDSDDDDIAATSLKVSLICPLGKIKMTLPVRATTCNHLQCFDGVLFIKMNDVKSTWQCPVCNQPCFYEDLFIDGYFVNVLKSNEFTSSTSEIQIEADGSVKPIVQKKRPKPSTSPANPCKKIKIEPAQPNFIGNSNPVPSTSQGSFSFYSNCYKNFPSETSVPSSSTCDASVTQNTPDCSFEDNQASKKVVLVDLTESDSEPEQEQENTPLNLKKYSDKTDNAQELRSSNFAFFEKQSPPIYDIDDFD